MENDKSLHKVGVSTHIEANFKTNWMNKKNKVVLITLISFGIYFLIDEMYFKEIRQWFYEHIYQGGTVIYWRT